MRITILTYLEAEDAKEHDPVVDQVAEALRAHSHEVSVLGAHGDLEKLVRGIRKREPELIFNLMEMFADVPTLDVAIVGLLDLLQYRYTGGGPGEFYLTQDKALSKKILAYEGILFPKFAVFARNADFETGGNLRMPLFVKPLRLDASMGIDKKALVHDAKSLMKRVIAIHEQQKESALVEEYIDGREIYVGVIGNQDAVALPPIEIDFSGLPAGAPKILDAKAKWDPKSREYRGTKAVLAELPDELRARVQKVSLEAYRALRVRDYGRVDLRLTDTGDIYVIEVNASCYLAKDSELSMAAQAAGIEHPQLVQRIVEAACARYTASRPTLYPK